MKNRSFVERFRFALSGIWEGWRRERSFRTQVGCALLALLALVVLRPGLQWWAIVLLAAAAVLSLELVNSALEALIDHLHPDIHPEIRIVKDMVAGAVLLMSIAALLVAFCVAVSIID